MKELGREYTIFLGVLVAVFLGVAIFNVIGKTAYLLASETAEGKIVEFLYVAGGTGGDDYVPRVEYTPAGGESLVFQSKHKESQGRKQTGILGQAVKVYYDPDNPKDAEIAMFSALWRFPIIMVILAAIVAAYTAWARLSPSDVDEI